MGASRVFSSFLSSIWSWGESEGKILKKNNFPYKLKQNWKFI